MSPVTLPRRPGWLAGVRGTAAREFSTVLKRLCKAAQELCKALKLLCKATQELCKALKLLHKTLKLLHMAVQELHKALKLLHKALKLLCKAMRSLFGRQGRPWWRVGQGAIAANRSAFDADRRRIVMARGFVPDAFKDSSTTEAQSTPRGKAMVSFSALSGPPR